MEQHPVPQNVTTFQFRLVGDMTLKQFGYLAGGVILAYVSSKLPLPFFFTWPMALFFGLGGFGLAFVPVEQRPMDIWITSFLKNTYNPTQYVWQKQAQRAVVVQKTAAIAPPVKQQRPAPPKQKTAHASGFDILTRLFQHHPSPIPVQQVQHAPMFVVNNPAMEHLSAKNVSNPLSFLNKLWANLMGTPKPHVVFSDSLTRKQPPNVVQPMAGIQTAKPVVLPARIQFVPVSNPQTPPAGSAPASPQPEIHKPPIDPDAVRRQNEKLALELDRAKKQSGLAQSGHGQPQPAMGTKPIATPGATVRTISGDTAVNAGIPKLTTFPNIVTGIVKDERGNLLPGSLVTVRDMQGVPLRALKTNRLGQFAASTPLPTGTYLIEIEDPQSRYTFDRAQISVNNTILPALEIRAKTQKEINRDKLAKEIFGNQIP